MKKFKVIVQENTESFEEEVETYLNEKKAKIIHIEGNAPFYRCYLIYMEAKKKQAKKNVV